MKEGDLFFRPVFVETLKAIADYGVQVVYDGIVGDKLVEDIRKRNGIITKEDLKLYK